MAHLASELQDSKASTLDWTNGLESLIVGSHEELNRHVQQGLLKNYDSSLADILKYMNSKQKASH